MVMVHLKSTGSIPMVCSHIFLGKSHPRLVCHGFFNRAYSSVTSHPQWSHIILPSSALVPETYLRQWSHWIKGDRHLGHKRSLEVISRTNPEVLNPQSGFKQVKVIEQIVKGL